MAAFPHVLDVRGFFFLVSFLLLVGFARLVGSIAKLLHPGIDLLQLYFLGIALRHNSAQRLGHRLALLNKTLHPPIQPLATFPPALGRLATWQPVAIAEIAP